MTPAPSIGAVSKSNIRTLGGDVPRLSTTPVSRLWKLWINCGSRRIFRELRFRARVNRSYVCARDVAAASQTGFDPVTRAGAADASPCVRSRPAYFCTSPRWDGMDYAAPGHAKHGQQGFPQRGQLGAAEVPSADSPTPMLPIAGESDRRAGLEVSPKPCNHTGDAVPAASRPSSNWGNENSLYRSRLGG